MFIPMLRAIENLREVARRCRTGEPLPASLSAWLGSSLDDFLSHRRRTIDDAFGLVWPRGGVPWWLEEAMRNRDAALRELALRFYSGQTVSRQAATIFRISSRYAETRWHHDRVVEELPAHHRDTPYEWLWRAFKSGAAMPIGDRQLRHVLMR
jgi:hypothetical protein